MESGIPEYDIIEPFLRADGTHAWARTNKVPLRDTEGNVVGVLGTYEDITERKRAEEALRESEERYRSLFERVPVGLYRSTPDGQILDVNPALLEMLGFPDRETALAANAASGYVNPETRVQWRALMEREGVVRDFEAQWRRYDGTVIWMEESVRTVRDADGRVLYYEGAVEDITERKRAEEALAEERNLLRTLMDNLPGYIYAKDLDSRFVLANIAVAREVGMTTSDEMIGKTDFDFFPEELAAQYYADEQEIFRSGQPLVNQEEPVIDHAGNKLWVLTTKVPWRDSQGRIIGLVGMNRDITERKRAEEERLAHLRFLESMDQINRAIQGTNDLEQMMGDVLDVVLSIFDCDRAFLLYPCDPEAASWCAPMERTKPEYPGAHAMGLEAPMDPDVARVYRLLLESDGPVKFGPDYVHPLPREMSGLFGYKSQILMALYPKKGAPWVFGLHQCSYPRVWTQQEGRLLQGIGWRLADGLTSLLMFRSLRESEGKLAEAQCIAHVGYWERDINTDRITWSDETYRIFGLRPQERILSLAQLGELLHPEDQQIMVQAVAEALRGGPRYDVEYRVIRPNGEVRVVHSQGDVTWDKSGRPLRMFGTVQDITERKRAEEVLRQRTAQLEALRQVSLGLTAQLDLDALLQSIVSRAIELLGGTSGGLDLYRPERDVLEWSHVTGPSPAPVGMTMQRGEGLSGTVWEMGKPLIVNDYQHWEGRAAAFEGLPNVAVVGAPMQWGEEFLGVLIVEASPSRTFSPTDAELLSLFASQAAIAIRNARLYEEAQQEITERKRAEEALRESEEKYRLLVENATVTIIVAQDGMLKFFNPKAMELTGYSQEELTSQPFTELIHPDDLEVTVGYYLRFLQGEETPLFHAFRIIDKEGNIKWLESNAVLITWEGRPATLNFISDITDRVRAEEALRESEERFRSLFEGAEDHIFIVDQDLQYVTVNPSALKASGFTLADCVGKGPRELFPEDAEFYLSHYRQVLETGEPIWFERELRLPDGFHWFSVTLSPIKDARGRTIALTGISRDITERKQAEEALRESEEKFRTIFESVPISMILIDKDGIMVEVSPHQIVHIARGLTPREDYIGESLITHPTIVNAGLSDTYRGLLKGEPFDLQDVYFPSIQRGTEGYYFNIKGVPLFKEDEVIGAITVHEEITERKRAEEALHYRAEELASLQAIVLEITAPHDLPTLLHTIVERAVQLLDARGGGMYLCDPGRREARCVVSYNTPHDYTGTILEYGEGAAGTVAQTGEPLIIDDYRVWGRRAAVYEEEQPFTAVLSAPMIWQDQVTGVIHILDDVESRHFTEADLALLTLFANHAAIAIENARLFEQVQAGRERLRQLTQQVVSAQEEERQRLARELHDELGQALTGIGFDLSAIRKELPSELDHEITKRLASASALLSQTDEWVSELALDLRPYMLDDLGLVSALRWYANRYAKRLDIEVELEAVDFEERLTPEVETALYRVVQEALTNVAKHAQANQVKIRLERKKATVTTIVEDDGQGFDVETMAGPAAPKRGAGLLGIRERASFLGGTLSIESTPGKGTRLAIEIPV